LTVLSIGLAALAAPAAAQEKKPNILYAYAGASGLLWMAPGVLLDWRHCSVDLVVILHHEIDIGRKFHGLGERFQF
jgi:hypothetical protein